jgi:hypothetical protein
MAGEVDIQKEKQVKIKVKVSFEKIKKILKSIFGGALLILSGCCPHFMKCVP